MMTKEQLQEELKQVQALLEQLEQQTEQPELTGHAFFMQGLMYEGQDELQKAQEQYALALENGIQHGLLCRKFGMLKLRLGDLSGAELLLRQAASETPEDPALYEVMIQMYLQSGRFDRAEDLMDELIQRNPERIEGYHHKVDLLLGTGQIGDAADLLIGVKKRFSASPLYVYDCCRVCERGGQPEEGLELLEQAKTYFDEPAYQVLYHKAKASLLTQMKKLEEALPLWAEVYHMTGDRKAGFALAAAALAKGDLEALLKASKELLAQERQDLTHYIALYYRAVALKALDRKDEAKAAFEAAAKAYETLTDRVMEERVRAMRVAVNAELGKMCEAENDFRWLEEQARSIEDVEERNSRLAQLQKLKEQMHIEEPRFC